MKMVAAGWQVVRQFWLMFVVLSLLCAATPAMAQSRTATPTTPLPTATHTLPAGPTSPPTGPTPPPAAPTPAPPTPIPTPAPPAPPPTPTKPLTPTPELTQSRTLSESTSLPLTVTPQVTITLTLSQITSTVTLEASLTKPVTLSRTSTESLEATFTRTITASMTITVAMTLTQTIVASRSRTLSWPLIPPKMVLVKPESGVINGDAIWDEKDEDARTIIFAVEGGILDPTVLPESLCIDVVGQDDIPLWDKTRFVYNLNYSYTTVPAKPSDPHPLLRFSLPWEKDYRHYDPRTFHVYVTDDCILGRVTPDQPEEPGFEFRITDTSMPITIPKELANGAIYAAETTGILASFTALPAAASAMQSASVMYVTECNQRLGYEISVLYHPFQFAIGGGSTRYWLASITMSVVVLLVLFIVGYAICDVRSGRNGTSLVKEATTIFFPSFIAPFWLLLTLPMSLGSTLILINGEAGSRVGAGLVIAFMLATTGFLAIVLFQWFGAEWEEFIPNGSSSDDEDKNDKYGPVDRRSFYDDEIEEAKQPITTWFLGKGMWVDADIGNPRHYGFCRRYGVFFDCFRDGRQWWVLVEWFFCMACGVASALFIKPATCRTPAIAMVVIMALYAALNILLKPYRTGFLKFLANTRSTLQFLSSLFGVLYHSDVGQWCESVANSIIMIVMFLAPLQLVVQLFLLGIKSKQRERAKQRIEEKYLKHERRGTVTKSKRGGNIQGYQRGVKQQGVVSDSMKGNPSVSSKLRNFLGNHLNDDDINSDDEDEQMARLELEIALLRNAKAKRRSGGSVGGGSSMVQERGGQVVDGGNSNPTRQATQLHHPLVEREMESQQQLYTANPLTAQHHAPHQHPVAVPNIASVPQQPAYPYGQGLPQSWQQQQQLVVPPNMYTPPTAATQYQQFLSQQPPSASPLQHDPALAPHHHHNTTVASEGGNVGFGAMAGAQSPFSGGRAPSVASSSLPQPPTASGITTTMAGRPPEYDAFDREFDEATRLYPKDLTKRK